MRQILDAALERIESPLQKDDRLHIKSRQTRRTRRKWTAAYVAAVVLGLAEFIYIYAFLSSKRGRVSK